jgi:tetratricopeptide (TPR) repeat protein
VRLAATGSVATRARVLAGQARLEVVSGKHRDATPVAREAVRLARDVGDRVTEGDALNTLGAALGRLGQSGEAISALEESLSIATEQSDGHGVIRAHNNLAIVLEAAGRIDDALAMELEGYAVARQLGLQRSMGAFIGAAAAISAVVEGRLEEADRITSEIIGDGVTGTRAANALIVRASTRLHLDDLAGARESIAAARAIAERANVSRDIVDVCMSEGEIAAEEGRIEDAVTSIHGGFALVDRLRERNQEFEQHSRWFVIALRVAGDSVELAATQPDAERLRAARADGSKLISRLEAFRRDAEREYPAERYHRVHLQVAEADATRVTGQSDPTSWRAAADIAARYRFRVSEAYAMWRLAAALDLANADAAEVEAALAEARQPSLRRASPLIARHVDELVASRQR